jgi:hypothetical protein
MSNSDTTAEFLAALDSLRAALNEYRQALRELYDDAKVTPRHLDKSIHQAMEKYDQANAKIISAQGNMMWPFFDRVCTEWKNRGLVFARSAEIAQVTGGLTQVFATQLAVISSLLVGFFLALQINTRKQIISTVRVPHSLAVVHEKHIRARRWLFACVVGLLFHFVGHHPALHVIGITSIVLGLLMFVGDHFYLPQRFYPGASLPGRLAAEVILEIDRIENEMQRISKLADSAKELQIRIPPQFEVAYEKMVHGQLAEDSDLLKLTQEGMAYISKLQALVDLVRFDADTAIAHAI